MTNRDLLVDIGCEDVVVLDPDYLDSAIIGVSHDNRAIYDFDKLVNAYVEHDGMTVDEAYEWIDYNVIRSLPYTPNSPIIMMTNIENENNIITNV